jgi:glucokinase
MKEVKDTLVFEEVDATELNGNAQDFVLGVGTGLGIVAAIVAIT